MNKEECIAEYLELRAERMEWEAEWSSISDYLLPGRGVYTFFSQPRKRKLSSPKAINTMGRDALRVLASGLQSGLIPSTRPWLELEWQDRSLKDVHFLKTWLEQAKEILEVELVNSKFYTSAYSALTETCGFGTGALFIDSTPEEVPFVCRILTTGEYVYATNDLGELYKFYRVIYQSPYNLVKKYGGRVSESTQSQAKQANRNNKFITTLECIVPETYQDKPFKRYIWEIGSGMLTNRTTALTNGLVGSSDPLEVTGFYDFPVAVARWEVLGNDDYGIGPGSEALPEIKRLQEVEKALRLGIHKQLDPPTNAPSYMRGQLKTTPGGRNYYRNPTDKVESLYRDGFDLQSGSALIERIEEGIKRKFFNDIFLTSSRDPNASPLKAAEVVMRDGEKMLRLGSVIERLVPEFIAPVIIRAFNILLRKGMFPAIHPEYEPILGDVKLNLVSPLAQAQKLISAKSIEITLSFIGQAQSIAPDALDKLDIDAAIDEYADAHGTPKRIFRSPEEIQQIRQSRAQAQQQQAQQQQAMQEAEMAARLIPAQAQEQKTRAEAGQLLTESLVDQQSLGGLI